MGEEKRMREEEHPDGGKLSVRTGNARSLGGPQLSPPADRPSGK